MRAQLMSIIKILHTFIHDTTYMIYILLEVQSIINTLDSISFVILQCQVLDCALELIYAHICTLYI